MGEVPRQGDADIATINAIVEAAHKRDGATHVDRLIQIERQAARAEGIATERDRHNKFSEMSSRCISERIVCGFIAEVHDTERQAGGTIPYDMVWTINSFTLEKIVKALLAAGYRPQGRVARPAE